MANRAPQRRRSLLKSIAPFAIAGALSIGLASLPFLDNDAGFVEVRSESESEFSISTFAIPGLTETGFAGCGPDQGKLEATTDQGAYWAAFASNERLGMKLQVNVSNKLVENSLARSQRLLEPNLAVSVDIIGGNEDLHQELVQQTLSSARLREPERPHSLSVDWPSGFSLVDEGPLLTFQTQREFSDAERRISIETSQSTLSDLRAEFSQDEYVAEARTYLLSNGATFTNARRNIDGFDVEIVLNSSDATEELAESYADRLTSDPSCRATIHSRPTQERASGVVSGVRWVADLKATQCDVTWEFGASNPTRWIPPSAEQESEICGQGAVNLRLHNSFDQDEAIDLLTVTSSEPFAGVQIRGPEGVLVDVDSSRANLGSGTVAVLNAHGFPEAAVVEILDAQGSVIERHGILRILQTHDPKSMFGPLIRKGPVATVATSAGVATLYFGKLRMPIALTKKEIESNFVASTDTVAVDSWCAIVDIQPSDLNFQRDGFITCVRSDELKPETVHQQFETLDYLGAVEFGLGIVGEQAAEAEQAPKPGFRLSAGIIRSQPGPGVLLYEPT
jgi:hypothetical protein